VTPFTDPDAIADAVLERVGRKVVLAMPLGLGKANHVCNALYRRAAEDASISLHIFTALTLQKPRFKSDLERRFLAPVIERTLGGSPDLAYVEPRRRGKLPPNIKVNEFFFEAGAELGDPAAQQDYISANYTHALRCILAVGVNVVGQLVARRGDRYSLSCNTDITLDLLRARAEGRADFIMVGQVNSELPFMTRDAEVPAETFAMTLDGPDTDFPLFAPPSEPVEAAHYAQGLHAAALVPDGGSLQLGIGSTSDAVVQALILRHRNKSGFIEALGRLRVGASPMSDHFEPFETGLYAPTEMFVAGFLALMQAGILKREVDGAVLHAGFFLGPRSFYRALRDLPEDQRAKLGMTAISFVNELYGHEAEKRAARTGGRFINTAMMATLLGSIVSDGLEDGRVVSGVGGQYNFVAQAFALEDARSILTLGAVRGQGRAARSNILWRYGHTTIPRHLRDVVITEYGVADLRGKSDQEVIAAMLGVADSRYQDELRREAVDAGKLPKAYEIPAEYRDNTPGRIERALKPAMDQGLLPPFPLGTDFDETELRLLPLMQRLQSAAADLRAAAGLLARGLAPSSKRPAAEALRRLGLERPKTAEERLYALLVRGAAAFG
jgi:Acetyl-CoA hydrolase/transferase C-terminal domain